MKFLAALVSLAASASAVDLYLHTNNDCGGSNHMRCDNMNPNTCCGTQASNYLSVAVRGISGSQKVQCRGYTGGQCSKLETISGNNGNDWICNRSNGFRYTGVGYNFGGRKRDTTDDKSECQRPNALIMADGTEFDLTDLNDEDFETLVSVGMDAEGLKDIPEEFQSLKVN